MSNRKKNPDQATRQERRERAGFRLTSEESKKIDERARAVGLNRSAYIRQVALSIPMRTITDQEMIRELKRLGALMKSQYPKHSNWSNQEKKEYWALLEQLNALAGRLKDAMVNGGV